HGPLVRQEGRLPRELSIPSYETTGYIELERSLWLWVSSLRRQGNVKELAIGGRPLTPGPSPRWGEGNPPTVPPCTRGDQRGVLKSLARRRRACPKGG